METSLSRTEKKRQAKQVENLARELAELSPAELAKSPCDAFLREEFASCRNLKGGARERQIKHLAKELRRLDPAPLLDFLEERKGSRLKERMADRELERMRNDILDEAIREYEERPDPDERFRMDRDTPVLSSCVARFPDLELEMVARAAEDFAATRKPGHSRQLLRLLRGAAEKGKYSQPPRG